jgi:membrane protease YdiL (CAAX protease family)
LEEQILFADSGDIDVEQKPRPWGFWPTIGFSIIIAIVFFTVQIIIVTAWTVVSMIQDPKLDIEQFATGLITNGLFQAIFICSAAPFTIGLTILFTKIRRGITIRHYLGFRNPGWIEIVKWSLVVVAFVVFFDSLAFFLNKSVVSEYMIKTYTSAHFVPLLWLALIIVGPLAEEIFFRGFLFEGIRHSKAGTAGAMVITSLLWSAMHGQYNLYGIFFIFVCGMLLGYVRIKSNSIYPPIAMHVLQNIIATIEVVVYLEYFPNAG